MEEFNFVEEPTSDNGNQKKILIAVAAVLVVLCGVLGYMWLKTDNELDVNIEESKAALAASAQDLLDLQEAYSGLSIQYDTINMQLDSSRMEVELLMQKLQDERKISNATIKQYQKELGTLRTIMKGYIVQIDSLQKLNTKLTADAAAARQEAAASRKKTEELSKTVESLSGQVSAGAVIKAYGLKAEAYNKSDKVTDRSSRTTYILTSLTLGENDLAEKGPVTVYIRVKDPEGFLLVNGSQKAFENNGEVMNCSASREVDYQGAAVDLGIYLNDIPEFTKGVYTVEAYTAKALLGTTEFMLR
jgi:predicted  nucleic acid-binding Zn-ribbon protein